MKKLKLAWITMTLLLVVFNSYSQKCATMPAHFNNYSEAVKFVRKAEFKFKEEIKIYKSSWLTNAEYYSCNGVTGIFIFTTIKGREYIMKNVPIEIWKGFKSASSYGTYYNEFIRGKYHFPL